MSSAQRPRPGTKSERPRVLLLAYYCSPNHGSEAAVGWNQAIQCARSFETWVLVPENDFRVDIERHLATHCETPEIKFIFVPKPLAQRIAVRVPGLYYLGYAIWHRRAFSIAQQYHAKIGFDLVHQVTFCGFREPGYLWKLDAPFVWGPVGGTQNFPWRFLGEAGLTGAAFEALRNVVNSFQLRFSRRVRLAARRAAVLLAANSTVYRDFERVHGVTPRLLLETGIRQVAVAPRRRPAESRPLHILWSGTLAPWKGLPLLLKALSRLPSDVPYELRVLGKGRWKRKYQRLAMRLGVGRHTSWIGWLPYAEALEEYAWADVLAFTSLRDTSGNVVLEAMSFGVPVVCLDHQGVHDIVTEQCGIKVPVTTPREVIFRLSSSILTLALNPDARQRMGEAALQRATEYLWSRRGASMEAIYRQILDRHVGR